MSGIESIMHHMTLEEKIGQLFMIAISDAEVTEETTKLLLKLRPGGLYLSNDNLVNPQQASRFTRELQKIITSTRPYIPLLLAGDHEGVWALLPSYLTVGPSNMALGATRDKNAIYTMYGIYAKELAAIGLNMDLAPVLDVNFNPKNPIINTRSFGDDPSLVAELGSSAIKGLQENGIIATAKHFPGHGDTEFDSHRELPIIKKSLEKLRQMDLKPFYAAIDSGVEVIMTSHILYPELDTDYPASLSSKIINGYLRREMSFHGVVMTDSLNMGAITKKYGKEECVVKAVEAGADLLLFALEKYYPVEDLLDDYEARLNALVQAVKENEFLAKRVEESVKRLLDLKTKYKILNKGEVKSDKVENVIGSNKHKELELEIARKSITLVKNTDNIVPLKVNEEDTIAVISPISLDKLKFLRKEYTRGIGPNVEPGEPFEMLVKEICKYHKRVLVKRITREMANFEEDIEKISSQSRVVIFCTERYVLPGLDIDDEGQSLVINEFIEKGASCVVIGLRDPYELTRIPDVHAYIAAYGFRYCNIKAAVEVLFGKVKPKGKLPVSIPGMHARGHGCSE